MEKQVKDLWVKDLRSGKYTQTKETLQAGDSYCCLAVLCIIAEKHGVHVKTREGVLSGHHLGDQVAVKEWAGIRNDTGKTDAIYNGADGCYYNDISALNDSGLDFNEMADIIEKEWKTI